jgi:hypothetical protein
MNKGTRFYFQTKCHVSRINKTLKERLHSTERAGGQRFLKVSDCSQSALLRPTLRSKVAMNVMCRL